MAKNGGLDAEEVTIIRRALLIGLQSYGEIERLQNAVELCAITKEAVPEMMHPIDPTGSATTIGDFADALLTLEHAEVTHA